MIECIDNDDKRIFKKFRTLKKCSKLSNLEFLGLFCEKPNNFWELLKLNSLALLAKYFIVILLQSIWQSTRSPDIKLRSIT